MKQKALLFITVLWLITSILVIQTTYAKYLTYLSSEGNFNIASWKIVLNNQDVIENANFSTTLSLHIPETNYYVANALVPSAIGYFDLNIDATNVLLDVRYTLTCQLPATNDVTDLKMIGYSLSTNYSNITYLNSPSASITRVIAGTNTEVIRVFVKWIDDNNVTFNNYAEVLNDVSDTTIAVNHGRGVIQANIVFEQLTT